MASAPDNLGLVAVGYSMTGAVLGGYVAALFARIRRARRRAASAARASRG